MNAHLLALILCSATGVATAQASRMPTAAALADTYARTPSLASAAPTVMRAIGADEVQINRYTTQSTLAEEGAANPLGIVATVHFPRGVVESVGDAVRYLLVRTGYELASLDQADDRVKRVLSLKLPQSQRQLGPYRVATMLSVLMGAPFDLRIDDSIRTVSYVTRTVSQPSALANEPQTPAQPSLAVTPAALAGSSAPSTAVPQQFARPSSR